MDFFSLTCWVKCIFLWWSLVTFAFQSHSAQFSFFSPVIPGPAFFALSVCNFEYPRLIKISYVEITQPIFSSNFTPCSPCFYYHRETAITQIPERNNHSAQRDWYTLRTFEEKKNNKGPESGYPDENTSEEIFELTRPFLPKYQNLKNLLALSFIIISIRCN